jgi:Flp pilus assembly protein TadD
MATRSGPETGAERGPGAGLWLPALVLAASVAAAYSGTLSVPFLFDDDASIAGNPSLRSFAAALWPPIHRTVTGRPFLNLTLAANYAAGGTSVVGYHAVNIAIHALAAVVLFGVLRRTLAPRSPALAGPAAFSGALLWALHPLQTAAVTYVAQRAESLMGLLFLVSLYAFIRGSDGPRAWFAVSLGACLLGMATKEVMAAAPLVILAYDRVFMAGGFREALARRWKVYAALAATWVLLAFLAVTTIERTRAAGAEPGPGAWPYAVTQGPAIVRYLGLCLWPHGLVFDYGTVLAPLTPAVFLQGALVLLLAAASFRALAKGSAVGFLGASFFLVLAPTSSFMPVAGETLADYRMYLPSVAVLFPIAVAVHSRLGRAAAPLCLALAAVLGAATFARNRDYRSAEAIWADAVSKFPENYRAHNNLGGILEKLPGRQPEALAEYEASVRLKPDSAEGRVNLANALSSFPGRLPEAVKEYREALRLEPNLSGAYVGLGNAESSLSGGLAEAVEAYGAALRLDPGSAEAHFDLGNALAREPGRLESAAAEYREAFRIRPGFAKARFALALVLLREGGREAEAAAQLEEGLRLEPGDPQAAQMLADIRAGSR